MKVLIWILLVVVYLFMFGITQKILGAGALCGALAGVAGYGLWRLGRAWTRRYC